jgi:hypothetical protein
MRLLRAPKHSLRHVSTSNDDLHSWGGAPFAQDLPDLVASRHDAQLLPARAVPADPYKAWLEQREADRRTVLIF